MTEKDMNPHKEWYDNHCKYCSNKVCREEIYSKEHNYNAHQKHIVKDCAELKQIIKIIKED